MIFRSRRSHEYGNTERKGFAGTCLGLAADVAPCERGSEGECLNGKWGSDVLLGEDRDKRRIDSELRERGLGCHPSILAPLWLRQAQWREGPLEQGREGRSFLIMAARDVFVVLCLRPLVCDGRRHR